MADREFNVRISAETNDFSRGMNQAERESSRLGEALEGEVSEGANETTESLRETVEELRRLQREAIGTRTSMNNFNSSVNDSHDRSRDLSSEMQRLSERFGGELSNSALQAHMKIRELNREARVMSRRFGRNSREALNARDAVTNYALGLDDATFKQVYMRSQLGLTDGQLRRQANSIKLNARMTGLMGNQTEILTRRMRGLQDNGIKPEMMLPPSTIGQFQLLNETMTAGQSPISRLSGAYRMLGARTERVIKGWSAQKIAIKAAQGDMVKYGLLMRGITAGMMNMTLAFPIVGMGALFAYKTMFQAAMKADESLKKLADTTKGKIIKALEPLIQTAGQFLEVALRVVGAVADWVARFNEAHPAIAKVLGVIGFLLPAMTMLLLPLSLGVGLFKGWAVAINSAWTMIGGLVTMIGTASATFLTFAGIVALVGAAFINLWKNNEQFRSGVKELVNEMIVAGTSILQTIMQLVNTITPIIQSTLMAIMSFWTEHKDVIIPIVQLMWNIIKDTILGAINAIKNIIQGGLTIISGIINLFKAIAEGDFGAMWDAIKEIFRGAIKLVIGFIQGWLVMGALKSFKGLWTGAKGIVKGLWTSITNFFKSGVTGCISFIKNLVSTGISNFNTLKSFGANIFNALWQVIKSCMGKVVNAVKSGMNNAKNFLRSVNLFSIGKNIIQGLVNGVKSMARSLVGSVKGVVSNAIEGAKNLLGINSPSKLFRQFGEWTVEGYQIGVDRGEPASTRAVENFANKSVNAFTDNSSVLDDRAVNERLISSNSTTNLIDYNKMYEVMINAFSKAIESTGMNDPKINIDGRELTNIISPKMASATRGW